ncbi:MAG: SDR family oxidoreductase, partial [Lachnospiraceae bacterium]
DVGDYDFCKSMFASIQKHFGTVDVLVNNAGISYIGLFQDMKPEDWNRVLQVNLNSVFNCSNLAIPGMLQKKSGKIINISSVWGVAGASCEVAYSAAKGGLNAFTKALAKELAPSNIKVNAIACGAIDTEMNQFMSDEELFSLVDEIPMNRLGRAEEVADLAYHLAYKDNYLTGQVIGFDGGWI